MHIAKRKQRWRIASVGVETWGALTVPSVFLLCRTALVLAVTDQYMLAREVFRQIILPKERRFHHISRDLSEGLLLVTLCLAHLND